MDGYIRFRKSTLLPSYRDLMKTSELSHSKLFHISSHDEQIIIHYRNYSKLGLFGAFIFILLGIWLTNLIFFSLSWLGIGIMTFSIGIGIIIDYFTLFLSAFIKTPVIIDCGKEQIISSDQTINFQEIQKLTLIQTASEFMSGGKHYFNLLIQGFNQEQKIQLYQAYFHISTDFIPFGKFLDQIFILHGLPAKMDSTSMEFTNNFEHLPLID